MALRSRAPARQCRCLRAGGSAPRSLPGRAARAPAARRRRSATRSAPQSPGRVTACQAQVQRFERAVGDDDLVGVDMHAVGQVAQRDLAAQAARCPASGRRPCSTGRVFWTLDGHRACRGAAAETAAGWEGRAGSFARRHTTVQRLACRRTGGGRRSDDVLGAGRSRAMGAASLRCQRHIGRWRRGLAAE